MFATLSRSIDIAKATFGVMRKDPEMLLFPSIASVASLLFSALLLVPTFFLRMTSEAQTGATETAFGVLEYLVLFVTYFGLAFIATFSNVCVVYIAKIRFSGGDATFSEALRFALSRLFQIVAWSAVSASIGLALAWLDSLADNAKGIPRMVLQGVRSLIGFAWSAVTLFVVPAMVYENIGPFDALRRSASTLKETWGESLARGFGFGLLGFLLSLPGIALIMASFPAFSIHTLLGLLTLGGGIIYLIIVAMVMNVANAVFNTALFHFATNGVVVDGYESAAMQHAFG